VWGDDDHFLVPVGGGRLRHRRKQGVPGLVVLHVRFVDVVQCHQQIGSCRPLVTDSCPKRSNHIRNRLWAVGGDRWAKIFASHLDDDLEVSTHERIFPIWSQIFTFQGSVNQLPEDDTKRVHIGLRRELDAIVDFGVRVRISASHLAQCGLTLVGREESRKAKVCYLNTIVSIHEKVERLEITMNDGRVPVVKIVHAHDDLLRPSEEEGPIQTHESIVEHICQSAMGTVLQQDA